MMVQSTSLAPFFLVWGVLTGFYTDIAYIHMDLNTRVRRGEYLRYRAALKFTSPDTFYRAIFPLAPLVPTCIRRIAQE
jgi:hypothetical protein